MKVKVCLALLALASLGYAALSPIPISLTGGVQSITVTTDSPTTELCSIPGVSGCGGQFSGTVGGQSTNIWCVDSQLDFTSPQTGPANIVLLDAITAANTQYGNVGNLGGGIWTSSLGGTYNATDRYEMEAYLISQYDSFSTGLIANDAVNKAIQQAIWDITSNNTEPSEYNQGSGTNNNLDAYWWIEQAKGKAVNLEGWAVVSWVVTGGDASHYGTLDDTREAQTFLVRVTPEPGFYGALALGISGLVFFARRRKQA